MLVSAVLDPGHDYATRQIELPPKMPNNSATLLEIASNAPRDPALSISFKCSLQTFFSKQTLKSQWAFCCSF